MVNTLKFIAFSLVFYIMSRFRRERFSDGWVTIKSKTFHTLFFWGGHWQYRPSNIVMAVVGGLGVVIGVCLLPFQLPKTVIAVLLTAYVLIVSLAIIGSMIYECYIIHKRRKEADMAGRYIKKMRKK